MKLKPNELMNVIGGGITASMINAIVDGFQLIFDIGKSIGSSISRLVTRRAC